MGATTAKRGSAGVPVLSPHHVCPESASVRPRTFSRALPPLAQSCVTFTVDPNLLLDFHRELLKYYACFPDAPLSFLSLKRRKHLWHTCWATSPRVRRQAHALPRAQTTSQHQPHFFLLPSPSLTDAASRNTLQSAWGQKLGMLAHGPHADRALKLLG